LSISLLPHLTPLLKKPSLDKEFLSNYGPISSLPFLSELMERILKSRLDEHSITTSLYNKFQSAYTKFHSTKTARLSLHDHAVRAISTQQLDWVFSNCLLPLFRLTTTFCFITFPLGFHPICQVVLQQ
jgi:hypothetical protein